MTSESCYIRGGIHYSRSSVDQTRKLNNKLNKVIQSQSKKNNEYLATLKNIHHKNANMKIEKIRRPGYLNPAKGENLRFNPHMQGLKKSNRILGQREWSLKEETK